MEKAQYWNWAILSNLEQMGKVNTARGDCAGNCVNMNWRNIGRKIICVGWKNAPGDRSCGSRAAEHAGCQQEEGKEKRTEPAWTFWVSLTAVTPLISSIFLVDDSKFKRKLTFLWEDSVITLSLCFVGTCLSHCRESISVLVFTFS